MTPEANTSPRVTFTANDIQSIMCLVKEELSENKQGNVANQNKDEDFLKKMVGESCAPTK